MSEQLLSSEYPDDWKVTTIGDLTERVGSGVTPTGGSEVYKDSGVIFIRSQNVTNEGLKLNDVAYIDFNIHTKMLASSVENFDVLINITGASIGRVTYVPKGFPVANVNQHVCEIRLEEPSEAAAKFYSYILQSDIGQRQIHCLNAGGNREGLNFQQLRSFVVPEPPKEQLDKIAKILSTVDNLTEKTQTLIEKYTAIKQGMMADLFTRGIDMTTGDTPNSKGGKLRPSYDAAPELYKQTELGWVPKEWEVKLLGEISTISSGITLGNEYSGSDAVEVPYLRVANVQDGYLDLTEVKAVKIPPSHVAKYLLEVGDVLMNEGGDFDKLGRGTIWDGEVEGCCHQNHVFKVRAHRSKLFPEYLAYWSASSFGKSYFIMNSKQSTNLASINSSQLKKFPVLVPPLGEQEMILEKLLAADGNISKLVLDIDKNKRVKKGLMQDLLTGKVRVA